MDFLPDFKAWLKANPALAPLHGGRVFYRVPSSSAFPLLRVYRVGGGAENRGEFPVLSSPRVGIEVWGNQPSQYDAVRGLQVTLEDQLNTAGPQPLNPPAGVTFLIGALVTGAVDAPDPDLGWPRYTTTVTLTVRSL